MSEILFATLQSRLKDISISKIKRKDKKPFQKRQDRIYRIWDEEKKDWVLCLGNMRSSKNGYEECTGEMLEQMMQDVIDRNYMIDFLNWAKLPPEIIFPMAENDTEEFQTLHNEYRKQKGL